MLVFALEEDLLSFVGGKLYHTHTHFAVEQILLFTGPTKLFPSSTKYHGNEAVNYANFCIVLNANKQYIKVSNTQKNVQTYFRNVFKDEHN